MRDQSIQFDYLPGDKVTIKAFNIRGEVDELWVGKDGSKKYFVEYINTQNTINTAWFVASELE